MPPRASSSYDKPRLTPAEVDRFAREGYLGVHRPVLSEQKFQALADHFETVLAASPAGVRPEDLDVPHFGDPRLFDWLFDDAVLDLVEPIIGPDIALFSSHFICKPAGIGRRVPWHSDEHYWKGGLDPVEVVTVWLAVDRSDRNNGAMQVLPGSHRHVDEAEYESVSTDHSVFPTQIRPHQIDPSRVVTLELEPNHASLHHSGTWHGSDANTSDCRRCGYTMRYMSTQVRFRHEERGDWHHVYLARGRDHAGNRYSDPEKSYADAVGRRAGKARRGH